MTNVVYNPDHSVRALSRLTSQFKDKENIEKFIKIFMDELQEAEDALFQLLTMRSLTTAEGAQLDTIGEQVGALRAGQNDTEYRIAIGKQITVSDSGTAEVRVTTDGVSTGDPSIPGVIESMIAAGVGFYGVEVIIDPEESFAFRSTDEGGAPPAVGKGFNSTDAGFEEAGGEFVSVSI